MGCPVCADVAYVALLAKRHTLFQAARLCLSNATFCFIQWSPACQTPRILSVEAALRVKRHVLFQKKCQTPHSISKGLTFAQVDFLGVKRYVAFGEKSEVERGVWQVV